MSIQACVDTMRRKAQSKPQPQPQQPTQTKQADSSSSSHRKESRGREETQPYRVLSAPTITGPVAVRPQEPEPDCPKRRTEPTVNSFKTVVAVRAKPRKKDAPGLVIPRQRSATYNRDPAFVEAEVQTRLGRPYDPVPWWGSERLTPLAYSLAWKAKPARKADLAKPGFKPPKPSDKVGYVPGPLRFNLYYKGHRRVPRTVSDWERDTRQFEGNRGIPYLRFADLEYTDRDGSHNTGNGEFDGLVYDDSLPDTGFSPFGDPPIDRKVSIGNQAAALYQQKAKANRGYLPVPDRQKLQVAKLLGEGKKRLEIARSLRISKRSVDRTVLLVLKDLDEALQRAKRCGTNKIAGIVAHFASK